MIIYLIITYTYTYTYIYHHNMAKTLKRKADFPTDLQQLYGDFMCDMCYRLLFHDDSEIMKQTTKKYTKEQGKWKLVFLGVAKDEYYRCNVMIQTKGGKIPAKIWNEMEKVDGLLLESFYDLLESNGKKWVYKLETQSIEEILQIEKQWHFSTDGKSLKMSFLMRGTNTQNTQEYFYPKKLMKWLGRENEIDVGNDDLFVNYLCETQL